MGCDIHMFIEYRNAGCPWQADANHVMGVDGYCKEVEAVGRNYTLFGLLADVRGISDLNRTPKGIPHDASDIVRKAIESCDLHSPSYMSSEEFEKVLFKEYNELADFKYQHYKPTRRHDIFYDWYEYDKLNKKYPPYYSSVVTYCKKLKKQHNVENEIFDNESLNDVEVRIVFAFDS